MEHWEQAAVLLRAFEAGAFDYDPGQPAPTLRDVERLLGERVKSNTWYSLYRKSRPAANRLVWGEAEWKERREHELALRVRRRGS